MISDAKEKKMFEILENFSDYIDNISGAAANTRLSYIRDIRQMMEWMTDHGIMSLQEIGTEDLERYTKDLKDKGKSPATISRSIASMHRFFEFAMKEGRIFHDPSESLKAPKVIKKAPEVLNETEIKKLLEVPDTDKSKGLRDKAMLEMLVCTGLRVSELISLRLADVDLRKKTVSVTGTNGRTVPLDRRVVKTVSAYLDKSRPEMAAGEVDDTLFVSCNGEKMTRQGFWKLLRKYGREAGLSMELTPHTLRHSFAVNALRRGEDVHEVQSILGHRDISSVNEYSSLV
jgi:integrase/recombinase XerD